jgi:hypothetical protein
MPYTSVTRAQFRALVRNQLGSGGLASSFWRDTEINFIINESLRFYNLLTGYWKTRAILPTTAATVWYTTPGIITSNMRVSFNGFPMRSASLYSMDFGRSGWESEKTTDGGDIPTRPKYFIIGALNKLAIWPADAAGANSLALDGIAVTPILVNDASTLDVGQEDMNGLLDLCQHIAAFKEGGLEFKNSMESFKQFLEGAGERNAILKRCAAYRRWLGLDKGRQQRPLKIASEAMGAR